MHKYKVPIRELTKEERIGILEELINQYAENIKKQRKSIHAIEEEISKKKRKISMQEEKLKHYRHILSKVV